MHHNIYIDLAEQHALNILFKETQKMPVEGLTLVDFHKFRKGWWATFISKEFPGMTVEVTYEPVYKQVFVDLMKAIDRATITVKDPND